MSASSTARRTTKEEIELKMSELVHNTDTVRPSEAELELMFATSEQWSNYYEYENGTLVEEKYDELDDDETSEDEEGFGYYISSMARNHLTVLRTARNFELFRQRKAETWPLLGLRAAHPRQVEEYKLYLRENSDCDALHDDAFRAWKRAEAKKQESEERKRDEKRWSKRLGIPEHY